MKDLFFFSKILTIANFDFDFESVRTLMEPHVMNILTCLEQRASSPPERLRGFGAPELHLRMANSVMPLYRYHVTSKDLATQLGPTLLHHLLSFAWVPAFAMPRYWILDCFQWLRCIKKNYKVPSESAFYHAK